MLAHVVPSKTFLLKIVLFCFPFEVFILALEGRVRQDKSKSLQVSNGIQLPGELIAEMRERANPCIIALCKVVGILLKLQLVSIEGLSIDSLIPKERFLKVIDGGW